MQFSVWPRTTQPWDEILGLARHAERTGWDGVWLADHFMPSGGPRETPMLEVWTALTTLAAAVPRIRIGPLVLGNTYRHPAVVANMAATLDQLSGGRLVLGLGAGWQANEHDAYGIDLPPVPELLARFEEACEVVRRLLTEPTVTFRGRFYELRDAPMEPKARQDPLPLLIGGAGERVTLRIVARWADEWNTWGPPEVLAHKGALLDRHCEALGRDPARLRRSAQAVVVPEGTNLQTRTAPPGMPSIGGSAAELRDIMAGYADAGVDEFVLTDANTRPGPAKLEFYDWFATEVAADFR
jgi:F420-dependent oxidoreductase-like protein